MTDDSAAVGSGGGGGGGGGSLLTHSLTVVSVVCILCGVKSLSSPPSLFFLPHLLLREHLRSGVLRAPPPLKREMKNESYRANERELLGG